MTRHDNHFLILIVAQFSTSLSRYTRIAELNAALPLARLDGGISAIVGQEAILSSASAMMLVAETREKIVATHANLKQASDDIGLREVSYGDLVKPGKVEPLDVGHHLRAV